MSVSLTSASSQYLELASAVASAAGFTMGCWFKCSQDTANQTLMDIAYNGSHSDFFLMSLRGAEAGDPLAFGCRQNGGGYYQYDTSTGYSADAWHMAVVVAGSTTDRRSYLDGGSKGSGTDSVTPGSLNTTSIGRACDLSPGEYYDGLIAHAFIYNYAMNDAQIAALYAAGNPLDYDSGNLISCWPLTADANDVVGSNHMTEYNSPTYSGDNPTFASVPAILANTGYFSMHPMQPMRP